MYNIGSEKFGTEVMKDEECLLFADACLENGSSVQDAISDMRMIDAMLHAERLHLMVGKQVQRTRAGYYRKGSGLSYTFEKIIEARADGRI